MLTHKKFTFAFLCIVALLFTSCDLFGGTIQPSKPVKAPPDKQIYVVPLAGISDIATLDPALASDSSSLSVISMISTGLVQLDDKLQVRPQIASSWDQSPDGLTWTFHLQPHLKFSDGTPLTATDVAYSINRALLPSTRSTVAAIYLNPLKDSDKLLAGNISTLIGDSIRVIDDTTLALVTSKKAPYFLSMLTYPCSFVVEKKLLDKYGADFTNHLSEGGSSGPFKVSRYVHNVAITLAPNRDYYGLQPQLREVLLRFYPQADATYQAYQVGQVDMTGVPLSTLQTDRKRGDFHTVPQLWLNYYSMNYLVKPFDNIAIRQAFALAIDKTAIANNVWKGTVIPTNHIVPDGMPGYNPNITGPDGTQNLKGNPAMAQQLLKQGLQQEGWASVAQMPPIKLTYASDVKGFAQEVTAMIAMWQSVLGITVTPNPVDYNTLLAAVTAATNNPNGLQFWGLYWVGEYPDPQDWLTRQFDRGVPYNNMNYGQNTGSDATAQQAIQQQLEAADANMQADARLQAYQQAEQKLVNDVAWLPMEQVTAVFLRKPYVVGMVDNSQGFIPPDDWASIYILQH
jgi:oligopeptide transport system substrate-binding protein